MSMRIARMTRVEIPGMGGTTAVRRSSFHTTNSPPAPSPLDNLQPNLLVGNRYELIEKLAKTRLSAIWKAHDQIEDRDVVVKFINDQELASNENSILIEGYHEMFPERFDSGIHETMRYIVMEFIPGSRLRDLIESPLRIPLRQIIKIARDILGGLKTLHKVAHKVHRDVKPENVLVRWSVLLNEWALMVKLIDFGIACAIGHKEEKATALGSPAHMSPEQAKAEPVHEYSDVYPVGLMLYEMITKNNPMETKDLLQTLYNQVHLALPPLPSGPIEERFDIGADGLREKVGSLHYQLKLMVAMLSEKDPQQRLSDIDEIDFHLERLEQMAKELEPYEHLA